MAETKTRHAGEERLTPAEITALQARLAEEGKDSVTLRSLSEASGLDENTVREQLRGIRAEGFVAPRPWSPAPARPIRAFVAAGAGVLAIAGTAILYRGHSSPPVAKTLPSLVTQNTQQRSNLATTHHGGERGATPPGLRVAVSLNGRQHIGYDQGRPSIPQPYLRQRDQVVRVIESLAQVATKEAAKTPVSDVLPPFRDEFGNTFGELKPGYVHVAVQGWTLMLAEEIRYPFKAAERALILKTVEKVMANPRQAQADALKPTQEKIVSPPPGFQIAFAGRRLDERSGPALLFAPVNVGAVQRRLEAALANAISRDAGPDLEKPPADDSKAAAIPTPPRFLGRIDGPGGTIRFDIPSGPEDVRDRAIRDLAEKATRQMDQVNERAVEPIVPDGSFPPQGLKRVDSIFRR